MMPPAVGSRAVAVASASDRRQSTRQGRTSVTRPTNYYARTFAGRMAAMGGFDQTPPASSTPGFLPALTHFTQAVDALPKELIKHFSMFSEVEAKIHDPEHVLELLLAEIARLPPVTVAQRNATQGQDEDSNANASMQVVMERHQQLQVELFPTDFDSRPPEERADLYRRQLFWRLRSTIAAMLASLEEKLVVLTAAKAAKDKGLARLNNSYAHLDEEISEEARYGSLNHWAYADKEEKKKGGASHERHRREVVGANNLAAAAQLVHDADSIAAKSEARREAMLAKRMRQQQLDSDFDDRPVKKTHKRKAMVAETDTGALGLGITSNGVSTTGKRKKTEKALAAAAAVSMERSLSGALHVAAASGGRSGTSPRATPGIENVGKRKPRAAPAPAQARKRAALPTYSPPLASSPLAASFAIAKTTGTTAERPGSARARKNSAANSTTSAVQEPSIVRRPSSAHSNQQTNNSTVITELEQAAGINRDTLSAMEGTTPKEAVDPLAAFDPSSLKHEEPDVPESERMEVDIPAPAPVSTRAGRTSKTATPVVGTFPDIPMVRSRSTRNLKEGNGNSNGSQSGPSSENNSTTTGVVSKRGGHKKNGHSINNIPLSSPALKPAPNPKSGPPSSSASSIAPDPEYSDGIDEDGDEPRYCYCNEVSYGNMIACDNADCPREWFHLACVNMEKAPNARTKWFCSDECKEAHELGKGKGKKGGRPGSSRQ